MFIQGLGIPHQDVQLGFKLKMKENELEFMSVRDDEESNNLDRTYVDPSQAYEAQNDVIGNWLFNQSKVCIGYCNHDVYFSFF